MNKIFNDSKRVLALDAFRGFAILAMILSGQLPFHNNTLPRWMYHCQVPPPEHKWIPTLPGITWVDLVFPFFLFGMGAALLIALSKRIEKGYNTWKIYFQIIERGILLAFFALYVQAIRPFVISKNPSNKIFLLALLSFCILFLIYTRFPQTWNMYVKISLRISGWILALGVLFSLKYPDGSGFSPYRSDIIIVVLTNMAFFGSIIWMLTKQNLLLRLGLLGILMAIRLSNMPQQLGGWVSELWNFLPVPWIYKLYYLQYLFIVIPGTIVGDLILKWMREIEDTTKVEWSRVKYFIIAILMFFIDLEILVGMYNRWVFEVTVLTSILLIVGYFLMQNPLNKTEKFYKEVFLWACYWIILGLFFEPYEGGIKKDKATISYYFITSGMSILLIIFFSIFINIFNKQKWLKLLIDNGQNPMIAYAGINNLIIPIFYLTGMMFLLNKFAITPWLGFVKGLIITIFLTLAVSLFTRLKIMWRT